MSKRYRLEVNENQIHLIRTALEMYARLSARQYSALSQEINHQEAWDVLLKWERCEKVNFRDKVPATCFDMNQVIRHYLSWQKAYEDGIIKKGESRKWPEMLGVNYDEPFLMSEEPPVTIEEIEND